MKKTRFLSLVLALLMLCGTATLFSSCAKTGEMKLSRKTVELDLSEYTVVYADGGEDKSISTSFKTRMGDFAAKLGSATGVNFLANQESRTRSGPADPEILIGNTTREQSAKALKSIKGHGYTIQVIDNKIVIIGTTNLLTLKAVQFFEENYLATAETVSKTLSINKSAKAQKVEMIKLADKENFYFSTVYSSDLDTDPQQSNDREVYYGIVPGTGRDYAYDMLQDMQTRLLSLTEITRKVLTESQKTDQTDPTANEIIVGTLTTREETAACRSELSENEYGIFVRDGDIVLTAWNDAALQLGGRVFLDYLYECQYTDKDGNFSLLVPADLKLTGVCSENWVTDFPKPEGEGIELYTTAEGESNSLIHVYMGNGVNAAAYEAYTEKLVAAGYRLYGNKNTAEDSIFAAYTNKQQNTYLYVSYNAYKHADTVDYAFDQPTIRVISAPLSDINLLDTKHFTPRNPSKKTDSSITAVALPSGSIGTGYVIMTEDGKFFVLDGGGATTKENKSAENGNLKTRPEHEIDNLYSILRDLYVKTFGVAPSKDAPIEIVGWAISHNHGDHTNVLWEFSEKFGTYGKKVTYGEDKISENVYVTVDYIFGSYPTDSRLYNTGEPSTFMIDYMDEIKKNFTKKELTYIKLFTGQKLYFANLEIEVLFTTEDMVPQRIVTLNDSSSILRFTLTPSGKDASGAKVKGDPVSFVVTGDAYVHGGRWCSAMYGDYLQSDMVAVAHHGGPGTEETFYDDIAPDYIWFPNLRISYESYMKGSSWYAKVDQYICNDLESVDMIILADTYNTTMFFTVDGPALDALYDAGNDRYVPNDASSLIYKNN